MASRGPFASSLASPHLKQRCERFRGMEGSATRRNCGDGPATFPRSDILSPSAGNSIPARQLKDRPDVTTKYKALGRPRVAAALLAATTAGWLAAPALAQNTARETITVEGNRRIDVDTVRSYFHAAPDGQYDAA